MGPVSQQIVKQATLKALYHSTLALFHTLLARWLLRHYCAHLLKGRKHLSVIRELAPGIYKECRDRGEYKRRNHVGDG